MPHPTLIVIGGATATGKTEAALQLAEHFGAEILSADSRQCYRGMTIGTAKPTPEELSRAPHHFIDCLDVDQPFSAGDFERKALQLLDQLFENQQVAIMTGGSGLFLQAVCNGMDAFPAISADTRRLIAEGERIGGLPWLQQRLAELDPTYFQTVDRQNPARLRRALQVCLEGGQPYSSFRSATPAPRPFRCLYLLLERPREELYARIDKRVDNMVAAGLEQEAHLLYPHRHLPALQTVGYSEMFDYFDGKTTFETAVSLIKQHTRNYAKRQYTWFRKHGDWKTFHPEDFQHMIQYAKENVKGKIL